MASAWLYWKQRRCFTTKQWYKQHHKKKEKKEIIIKIQAELISINSMWPCLHMVLVYWNLYTMFLHMNRQAAPEHLLCTDSPGNYATPEHCVMTEPLPGTHYHCIRYGCKLFQVSTGQTSIGSAVMNLDGEREREWVRERERNVPLCLVASYFMPGYENLALISDILGCGNFCLAPSTLSGRTSRSKCRLIKKKKSLRAVCKMDHGVGVLLMNTVKAI